MPTRIVDLPADAKEEIYNHLPCPYLLKVTCRGMRDGAPEKTTTKISKLLMTYPSPGRWAEPEGKRDFTRPCHDWKVEKAHNGKMIGWLRTHRIGGVENKEEDIRLLCAVAGIGRLSIMDLVLHYPWAAFGGFKRCVRASTAICTAATKAGELPLLKYLTYGGFTFCNPDYVAAQYGQMPILKWLHERGKIVVGQDGELRAAAVAAQYGQLHVLEDLLRLVPDFTLQSYLMTIAIASNQRLAVLWLYHKGCPAHHPYITWSITRAMMPRLESHRYQGECVVAARSGDLPLLKWLVRVGYERCERTIEVALLQGYVEIAVWAAQHGFPISINNTQSTAIALEDFFSAEYEVEYLDDPSQAHKALREMRCAPSEPAVALVEWYKTYMADKHSKPLPKLGPLPAEFDSTATAWADDDDDNSPFFLANVYQ